MLHRLSSFLETQKWTLYQKLETDIHDLKYIFWETTRECNLNCIHCGSDCGKDDSQKGLPKEEVIKVFAKIAQTYDPSKIMLVVSGGEPLVRRDLFEILGETLKMGFRQGMVTNGYTLDFKKAKKLAEVGIISIVVSLDGPKKIHDWIRNRKGSFERAVNALKHLKNVNIPLVEAITCVTPRTLAALDETYEIVKSTGATHWRLFNIFPIGRAKDNYDLILSSSEMKQFIEKVAQLRAKGKDEGMVVNLSEEGYLGMELDKKVRDTPYFCRAGINFAGIMADGTIAACPNLPEWMGQGNVKTHDFPEVWENQYDIFRDRKWMGEGTCKGCKHFNKCLGNSLHIWDVEKNGPAWCHYKIMKDKTLLKI
jgi:radical SAM protein with 4Fe4S-binding SPASM domain